MSREVKSLIWVFLGMSRLMMPLVFSMAARCQGEWGSHEKALVAKVSIGL
jgi:hypothetical protein